MSTVLLGLDTTTEACSVAVFDGSEMHAHRFLNTREHAVKLLPMIEEMLATAGVSRRALDAIAFTRGPGSFTGCRIGTATAQAFGLALDRPLVAVSTLETLAEGAKRELGTTRVAAAIDARMGEVYWGCFEREGTRWCERVAEQVCDPGQVAAPGSGNWVGVGTGWAVHGESLAVGCPNVVRQFGKQLPDARDTVMLALPRFRRGDTVSAAEAEPVYLRDKVALTTAERQQH
ncbi:MAG: tRNA (adenosine(37)-N6)-threonylcarbamoyltransferase complex dimerization subunit type 1 TsaB [Pseudomonadota bacterium]